eukprot:TRINITY_DN17623_c1_g1_i13.p3 TRINITY_DN17623_c1_g1~~TRINITY_DN17623_c1_g1_i13.p3  ORF type:complete len:123 (+),score=26.16 TRINITY_DN17623_c1_g1_i13:75-443(+)
MAASPRGSWEEESELFFEVPQHLQWRCPLFIRLDATVEAPSMHISPAISSATFPPPRTAMQRSAPPPFPRRALLSSSRPRRSAPAAHSSPAAISPAALPPLYTALCCAHRFSAARSSPDCAP